MDFLFFNLTGNNINPKSFNTKFRLNPYCLFQTDASLSVNISKQFTALPK